MSITNKKFTNVILTLLLLVAAVVQPISIGHCIFILNNSTNGENLPTYSGLSEIGIILPIPPKAFVPVTFNIVENFKHELTHTLVDDSFELYSILNIHSNNSPLIIYKNPLSQFTSEY